MRKSLSGLFGIKKSNYKNLPKELHEYSYFIPDSGNCIMVIPEIFRNKAYSSGKFDDYEIGVPTKYVLEKGYEISDGYVFCDVPYDDTFGVITDDKYEDWDQSGIIEEHVPDFITASPEEIEKAFSELAKHIATLKDPTALPEAEKEKLIAKLKKRFNLFSGDVYVTDICAARTVSKKESKIMKDFERRTGATVYHIITDIMGMTYFLYVPATRGALQAQINTWGNCGNDWMYAYCYNEMTPAYSECGPIHVRKLVNNCLMKVG